MLAGLQLQSFDDGDARDESLDKFFDSFMDVWIGVVPNAKGWGDMVQ